MSTALAGSRRVQALQAIISLPALLALLVALTLQPLGHALPALPCDTAQAQREVAAQRFAAGAANARALLRVQPGCVEARYLLAESLLRVGSAKESLAEYTTAALLRKPRAEDLRNVALDYVLLNDYIDARRWATYARDLAPGDAESWYVLGRIAYTDGNAKEAAACFEQTLHLDPASGKAENNLGLAYEGLGQEQTAVAAYRKAIAMGEQSTQPSEQPFINLAILLMHGRDAAEALPLLLRAVSLAPRDARAREQLGKLYMQTDRLGEAQASLAIAVSLSPGDSRLHFLLGQVYRKQGLNEKAATEFARVAELAGTHSTPDFVAPPRK